MNIFHYLLFSTFYRKMNIDAYYKAPAILKYTDCTVNPTPPVTQGSHGLGILPDAEASFLLLCSPQSVAPHTLGHHAQQLMLTGRWRDSSKVECGACTVSNSFARHPDSRNLCDALRGVGAETTRAVCQSHLNSVLKNPTGTSPRWFWP